MEIGETNVISFLLSGATLGLYAGFSPGALFAMVISQTIRYGLREGFKVAMAPLITDLAIVAMAVGVMSLFSSLKPLLGVISLLGGAFVCYLGYENIRFRAGTQNLKAAEPGSVLKAAMVNALSPHPYLFWFVIGGPIVLNAYTVDVMAAVIFIASFYICLVGAKITLAIAVNHSRGFLQGPVYVGVMRALGVVLILFALKLFWDGIQLIFYEHV